MSLALVSFVAASLAAVPDSVFDNKAPWSTVETDGALTVESRKIEGTPFSEYRVVTMTDVPADVLCIVVFEWGTTGKNGPGVKEKKLLKDGETVRVVYSTIEQPMISNRDYAMTVRRENVGEGACRIRFKVTNDEAPAVPEGFVRMENMWGGWQFDPLEGGKTKLTYVLFADPGGAVPPFLVHGGQRRAAKDSVLLALEKAHDQMRKTGGDKSSGTP